MLVSGRVDIWKGLVSNLGCCEETSELSSFLDDFVRLLTARPPVLDSKISSVKQLVVECGTKLGGGNSNILYLHPYFGKWSNLTNMFQMGWNHQLD